MSISLDSVVVVSKDQVSCDLAGEAAILHLKSICYYGLNPVGAKIWNLLQVPRSVKEIRQLVLSEYDVQAQSCELDLIRLLNELEQEGLIEVLQ
jgi:hypothetical protein